MGRLIFQVAGAVIGGFFGGPQGAALGAAIGGGIGGVVFGPDGPQTVNEGPRLSDLKITNSEYGAPIPWVFGTQRVGSQMIWATDIEEVRTEVKQSGGKGGGGGGSVTNVTFTYFANAAFLCSRGVKDILKIWGDGKLIFDTENAGQVESAKYNGLITRYQGTTTQEPDPTIQAELGVDDTPAYRDVCYFVINAFPLEDFGNRIPQFSELITDADDFCPIAELDIAGVADLEASGDRLGNGAFSPDKRFFAAGSGDTSALVFDTLNQSIVTIADHSAKTSLLSRQHPWRFDSEGNLVLMSEAFNDDNGMFILSFPELEFLAHFTTNLVSTARPNRHFVISPEIAGLRVKLPEEPKSDMIVVMDVFGRVRCWRSLPGGTLTFTLLDGETIPLNNIPVFEFDLDDQWPPSSPASSWNVNITGGSALDRDGFCWFVVADNQPILLREMYLFKIDAWNGTAVFKSIEIPLAGSNTAMGKGEMGYDPIGHRFVIHVFGESSGGHFFIQYDIDTDTFGDYIEDNWIESGANWDGAWANSSGELWFLGGTGGSRAAYNFATHTIGKNINILTKYPPPIILAFATGGVVYDELQNALIISQFSQEKYFWLFLDRLTGNSTTLKAIVDAVSDEVGLDAGDLDTTDLASTLVRGYAVSRRMTARAVLEPLRTTFFFDAAESDYQMTFKHRGAGPVLTLVDDDLGASNDVEQATSLVVETRAQEIELPLRIDITFADPNFDYQEGSQYAKRADEAVTTQNEVKISVAVVLTNSEAKDIAEKQLFTPWVERDQKQITTTWQHLALDPTDVILIQLTNGLSFRVYVLEVDTSVDGVIEITGVLQDAELSTSRATVVGTEAEGFNPSLLVVAAGSKFFIMDIPLLQDSDDGSTPIILSAAGRLGQQSGTPLDWQGARIDRSFDGADYTAWTFHNSASEVSHGAVSIALPATSAPWVWDRTNTINVVMAFGTLTSVTEAQVLDGANAVLLGKEIIQFANATLEADGSYTLDTLLRARRGTDLYARTGGVVHSTNERFVVLTAATINAVAHSVDNLNRTQHYRAVTVASPGTSVKTVTPVGQSKYPYAPYLVTAVRDGSGDVTLNWSRRTRIGGAVDWGLGVGEPPLGEDTETYQIAIIDDNGSEISFETVVDVTTLVYTAAQSDIDFGTGLDPLTGTASFIVYQISATVGRGFPSETVTA